MKLRLISLVAEHCEKVMEVERRLNDRYDSSIEFSF
nr:MAG TPA: hypothetical protein [Siphoviridae sp. cta6m1]